MSTRRAVTADLGEWTSFVWRSGPGTSLVRRFGRWFGGMVRTGIGGAVLIVSGTAGAAASGPASLAFQPHSDGGFAFDTGVLKGRLRAEGRSLGLQQVVHVSTRQRVDRGNGLFGHYRVFSRGVRYGAGAWDWPSAAGLGTNGAVVVTWPATDDRPFVMDATYRWLDPATLEVETVVRARVALKGFECLLANYFAASFTNAAVWVGSTEGEKPRPKFLPALPAGGDWQIFPRDDQALGWIRDGRWALEPHPVNWSVPSNYAQPVLRRRAPKSGLSGIVMAPRQECFAVATPHEQEGHYSAYLSLLGRDLEAGETARARARLSIEVARSDGAVAALYERAALDWAAEPSPSP